MKWVDSGFTCPKCGGATEYYEWHRNWVVYIDAERCPACKWQINFNPTTKTVPYGSEVALGGEPI